MDQLISVVGRAAAAPCASTAARSPRAHPVPTSGRGRARLGAPRRTLVDTAYNERRSACKAAAAVSGVPALHDTTLERSRPTSRAPGTS